MIHVTSCSNLYEAVINDILIVSFNHADADSIKSRLFHMYRKEIKLVKISPIHDKFLELDDIYVPFCIKRAVNTTTSTNAVPGNSLKNILFCNDTFAERIFIKGESGCGKTIMCLKLIESWMLAKQSHPNDDNDLVESLSTFDLVFYVPLRDSRGCTASLEDMICDIISKGDPDIIKETKVVLRSPDIRCLIVVDGVDEWKKVRLEYPDTYGLVNCVMLSTMRPWAFNNMQLKLSENDIVYEILGINPESIETMTSKVLIHFCGLPSKSDEYRAKCTKYCKTLKHSNSNIIINPMMLLALILLWNEDYENNPECKNLSRTRLYLSMIQVMIQRAEQKDHGVRSYIEKCIHKGETSSLSPVKMLSEFRYIMYFGDILLPLSKIAHDGLLMENYDSVFEKHQLQVEIGPEKVSLALKSGIMSERKAYSRAGKQYFSIHFLHKSIQELLSAIYIMHCGKKAIDSFLDNCSSVVNILKQSNLITFICGLDFQFGDLVLEYVLMTAEDDQHITQYRSLKNINLECKEPNMNIRSGGEKVKYLFYNQCIWYNELTLNKQNRGTCNSKPIQYHIRDIFLDKSIEDDAIDMTIKIMLQSGDKISSISILDEQVLSKHIIRALWECKHITSLQICNISNPNLRVLFCRVVDRISRLRYVNYWCCETNKLNPRIHNDILTRLLCKPTIIAVNLCYVAIDGNVFSRISETKVDVLCLRSVSMTNTGWAQFTQNIRRVRHRIQITLQNTDVDESSVSVITSCPKFTMVINDGKDGGRQRLILFYSHPPNKLKHITLANFALQEAPVTISARMTSLKTISLRSVHMPPAAWRKLINELIECTYSSQNEINVNLKDTDIDAHCIKRISRSSAFTVTLHNHTSEDVPFECLSFFTKPSSGILEIEKRTFGDNGFTISDAWSRLQEIHLSSVQMSGEGWRKFVDSIMSLENIRLKVIFFNTNINDEAKTLISSCPNILMQSESVTKYIRKRVITPCENLAIESGSIDVEKNILYVNYRKPTLIFPKFHFYLRNKQPKCYNCLQYSIYTIRVIVTILMILVILVFIPVLSVFLTKDN